MRTTGGGSSLSPDKKYGVASLCVCDFHARPIIDFPHVLTTFAEVTREGGAYLRNALPNPHEHIQPSSNIKSNAQQEPSVANI